jgi:F-type H+-transporting ATPase subunit b
MNFELLSGAFWMRPVFWVAVAFVIFFVLFGRKLWAVLATMLDGRITAIQQELAEAASLRREAEAMLQDAQAQREAALASAARMLDYAREEAARVSASTYAEAEAAAMRRERMALDRISAAEIAALREVRVAAVDIATIAAEQVIRQILGDTADAVLVDRAISEIPYALGSGRMA